MEEGKCDNLMVFALSLLIT